MATTGRAKAEDAEDEFQDASAREDSKTKKKQNKTALRATVVAQGSPVPDEDKDEAQDKVKDAVQDDDEVQDDEDPKDGNVGKAPEDEKTGKARDDAPDHAE